MWLLAHCDFTLLKHHCGCAFQQHWKKCDFFLKISSVSSEMKYTLLQNLLIFHAFLHGNFGYFSTLLSFTFRQVGTLKTNLILPSDFWQGILFLLLLENFPMKKVFFFRSGRHSFVFTYSLGRKLQSLLGDSHIWRGPHNFPRFGSPDGKKLEETNSWAGPPNNSIFHAP